MASDLRKKIATVLADAIQKWADGAAVVRRDGTLIEACEKKKGTTNWKALAVAASSFLNSSEAIANEIQRGSFETSILETDYQRIVVAKISSLALLVVAIPKQNDYSFHMLEVMKAVKEIREILA